MDKKILFLILTVFFTQSIFSHKQNDHQHVVREAYKILENQFGDITAIASHISTAFVSSTHYGKDSFLINTLSFETGFGGNFLFNLGLKYKFTENFNIGIKLLVIPRFIWENGAVVLSSGWSSTNYDNQIPPIYTDGEIGLITGVTSMWFRAHDNYNSFVGAYYHGEVGFRNGLHFFLQADVYFPKFRTRKFYSRNRTGVESLAINVKLFKGVIS